MFGNKSNQNNPTPPPPPINSISNGAGNSPTSSSLDFTSQTHSSGPQQLTSVRIKEPFGKIFIFFTTFILITATAFTGYLFLSKKKIEDEITALTSQKNKLMAEYQKPQNTELRSTSQDIVNKLKDFDKILNKRIEWTKILKEFNRETLKNTVYTDISITADGTMQLTGQTADNNSFAKLYRAWESSEIIDSISVSTFDAQESSTEGAAVTSALGVPNFISFSLILTLKAELIYPQASEKPSESAGATATDAPAQTTNTTQPTNNTTK